MDNKNKVGWLISKKLTDLIGIEYRLLKESGEIGLSKFYLAGLSIVLILGLSFASIFYAFDMMFKKWQIELLLSAFFSGLFVLIYILLIHTFSKSTLPVKTSKNILNLSNTLRLGYVLFIAFIISKPIEAFVLRDELDSEIFVYKKTLLNDFNNKTAGLYSNMKFQEAPINQDEILKKTRLVIGKSEFFIKRIQLLLKNHPNSWIICLIIIFLFFLPGLLIYSVSGSNTYYRAKRNYEKSLVEDEYKIFKSKYTEIFEKKFELQGINFHESFTNPPFNTEKKEKTKYNNQDDFINKVLYGL